jgi:acyl-coenzyme A thioesterase PaaI-like protein
MTDWPVWSRRRAKVRRRTAFGRTEGTRRLPCHPTPSVDILARSLPYAMIKITDPGALDPQTHLQPALPVEELRRLLSAAFPEMFSSQGDLSILEVWHGGSRVRKAFAPHSLRPGGTISGPVMMALADATMYIAVLGSIGWKPLAVTTSFHINFLKKPAARALDAECRLLKLGKRLAVGEIWVRSQGEVDPVAHASATYSIPNH